MQPDQYSPLVSLLGRILRQPNSAQIRLPFGFYASLNLDPTILPVGFIPSRLHEIHALEESWRIHIVRDFLH